MMRFLILFASLWLSAGPAAADQFDPALGPLFEDLRAGRGDTAAIEAEIEQRWLTAPEAGTTIIVERIVKAIDTGEFAVAELLVDHLTGLAPQFAEGFVLQGQLALARNDETTARIAFRRAILLEPRHYRALEKLGDLALSAGDRELAHQRYREALDWNPRQDDLRRRADRLRQDIVGREI